MKISRNIAAHHFHSLAQIEREDLHLGDEKYLPLYLQDDARVMTIGYVGKNYERGKGIMLLGINPGGGGVKFASGRSAEDKLFYPNLYEFKATGSLESLAQINKAYTQVLPLWNLWRILGPTIEAAGRTFDEIAYMNVVPYRTRDDKTPPVATQRQSWTHIVEPTLELLQPNAMVSLGMKAGKVVQRFHTGDQRHYCVQRTIGDSWVCEQALSTFEDMRREMAA
jgi:hypothetical protein